MNGEGERAEYDETRTTDSDVANTLSGTVLGPTVQAGLVGGDIHLHAVTQLAPTMMPVPREIPHPPVNFVGRASHIELLERWLSEDFERCLIVAVGGSGGVGKTALGASWFWQHDENFADGNLYVDLGGGQVGEPVTVSDVLGRFLRALGIPAEQVPLELGERAALYRSKTADRSLAIMLDNATSAAQVRQLLPNSPRSAVIITSRVRLVGLALDGARFLDLTPLSTDDAVEMLSCCLGSSRIEDERQSAWELARLCSGFPLAIAVLSARLMAHPRWPLSLAVRQLQDECRRLKVLSLDGDVSVRAVFDSSYKELGRDAAWLYRQLAVCPGTELSREVVEKVAGDDVGDVWAATAELVESNLLVETEQGYLGYHDLLRIHARQIGMAIDNASIRDEVVKRSIDCYLDRAVEADLVVNPQRWHLGPRYEGRSMSGRFQSAEQALDWFEQERLNMLSVLHEAHQRHWDDDVWQWCEAMWSFFLYRKHYQDWIETHRLGIESAINCEAPLAQARVRCQLGFAYLDLNQFDAATEVSLPALELAEAEGDRESISTALSQLAKSSRGSGDLQQALVYFRRSLALVRETGNKRGIALRLRRIGTVLADLGHYNQAIDNIEQSVSLLEECQDERGRARAMTILGRIYLQDRRHREASATLLKALEVMRESGSPTYQADIYFELAVLAERATNVAAAGDYLRKAEALYRESGHPRAPEIRKSIDDLETRL